jgi:hypothetical protein
MLTGHMATIYDMYAGSHGAYCMHRIFFPVALSYPMPRTNAPFLHGCMHERKRSSLRASSTRECKSPADTNKKKRKKAVSPTSKARVGLGNRESRFIETCAS